jgi:hypothetical protein
MRSLVLAEDDHEGTSRRNSYEIRMRHAIPFAAHHVNLEWPEGNRTTELTYGLDDHCVKYIATPAGFLK